jgi:prepilin-type N-terminal cleavage/methylation domain-containing protein
MTLLELMIAVSIIGVLASVAIPSFRNYQYTSKTAEAKANLGALGKAQKAYYAEFNTYVAVLPEPLTTLGVAPSTEKRPSASVGPAFGAIGWVPEGDVFYDYDSHTPTGFGPGACPCTGPCFTASAYGDVDGNGIPAVISYGQPDSAGNMCSGGFGGGPPVNPNEPVHDVLGTGRF